MSSTETQEKLQSWAAKSGKPVTELQQRLQEIMQKEQARSPMATPLVIETKARSILYTELKGEVSGFKSPAVYFNGIVLGRTEPFDMNKRKIEAARTKFQSDTNAAQAAFQAASIAKNQGAIVDPNTLANLCTNEAGVPIDTTQKFKNGNDNPNFLKPLDEHNYVSNIFGIAAPSDGPVKPFKMALMQDRALQTVPIGSPTKFRANPRKGVMDAIKAGTAKLYELNDSTATKFEPADPAANVPGVFQALEIPELADFKAALGDLKTHHDKTKNDYNRVVITEGTATVANAEPVGTRGTYRLVLDDESIPMDAEGQGVTVWVPAHLKDQWNFGVGTKVVVIGQTQEGPAYNRETRAPDPVKKEITINAIGLLVNPELYVARDEQASVSANTTQTFM